MFTVDQFAESIKAKHPDYQSIDNAELTRRVLEKYPAYKDQVSIGGSLVGAIGKQFGLTGDSSIGKAVEGVTNTAVQAQPERSAQPQAGKGFGERFGEQVLQAPGKMFDIAKEQIVQPVLTSGAKAGLGLSAPIVDPISKAITGKTIQQRLEESPTAQAVYGEENVKNLVPKDVTDWAGAATETIANLLVGSEGSALMKASPKGFALLKQLASQGAKFGGVYGAAQGAQVTTDEQGKPLNTAQRIGEVATGAVKGAATGAVLTPLMGTVASKYMNKATGGATKAAGVATKEGELPTNIEQVVKETWQSGTKPTGKSVDVPISKVGAAMLDTVENKPKLKFTDASGELIEGQLPRTHAEYTQVAQNRMDDIFNQYDAMAKSAGEKGAVVEFTPIAAELNKLADNQALRIKDPNTIKYAQEMALRLESEGAGTPKNVQETIKMLNSDLQNFYRNPGYESSGRAFVDAAVAKELRTRLDSTISSLEGDGYQDLKNTYGAWSSILDAIEHRATLEARKNKIGLVDSIYNMGSIADLGRALVTRSPASFTTSAMQQVAKFFTKYVNSPDAILKRNFTKLEGIVNEGGMPIKGSVPKVKSSIPKELKPLTEKTSFNAGEIPTQLVNEAKKYKSAEEFVKAQQERILNSIDEEALSSLPGLRHDLHSLDESSIYYSESSSFGYIDQYIDDIADSIEKENITGNEKEYAQRIRRYSNTEGGERPMDTDLEFDADLNPDDYMYDSYRKIREEKENINDIIEDYLGEVDKVFDEYQLDDLSGIRNGKTLRPSGYLRARSTLGEGSNNTAKEKFYESKLSQLTDIWNKAHSK